MKLPGVLFSDFRRALPADALSRQLSAGQWELADYTATHGAGTMLLCRGKALPPPVTIRPCLTGWHRIHVCLTTSGYPSPMLTLKLTRDMGASFFCRSEPNPKYYTWNQFSMAEEYDWECADMTGQEITVEKLHDDAGAVLGLLWLRFEPMDDEEVAAYLADRDDPKNRTLHLHCDGDWLGKVREITPDVYSSLVQAVMHSDAGLVSAEVYPLMQNYAFVREAVRRDAATLLDRRLQVFPEVVKRAPELYGYLTEQCHAHGRRVYAAVRHCLSKCALPWDYAAISHLDFADEHPELYCVDRDGEPFATISYAYPEAQAYLVQEILKVLPYGFDGVTLFFHRGVMTAFERPVLERCAELFPGTDARTLPLDDPRLVQVHCELMTAFVRSVRAALDDFSRSHRGGERLGLAIVGGYTIDDNLRYGVDVERWTDEGLITEVVVGNMRVYEDSDAFVDAATGLVDLDKYREVKHSRLVAPVLRRYDGSAALMIEGMPRYLALSRRTGLPVFFEVPWECSCAPEEFRNYALQLYGAGAERLSLWDAFHTRVMNRAEWNVVSRLGHRAELPSMPADRDGYGVTVRILSVNGVSIASYESAWRG